MICSKKMMALIVPGPLVSGISLAREGGTNINLACNLGGLEYRVKFRKSKYLGVVNGEQDRGYCDIDVWGKSEPESPESQSVDGESEPEPERLYSGGCTLWHRKRVVTDRAVRYDLPQVEKFSDKVGATCTTRFSSR